MGTSRKESEGNLNRSIGRYVCHFKGLVYQSLMPQTALKKVDPVHNGGLFKGFIEERYLVTKCFQSKCSNCSFPVI